MFRYTLIFLVLTFFSLECKGQKIEYRNDSLFVNDTFVDAQTSKEKMDSLLKSTSKKEKTKSDFPKCSNSKKVVITTFSYNDLGMFIRKYDCDSTKLSIAIQLYHDSDPKYDNMENRIKSTFKGSLIIGGNFINDKRQLLQLEQMNNCQITVSKINIGSMSRIIGGDIIYQQSLIRLVFDHNTNELTQVYIHHNFKDR